MRLVGNADNWRRFLKKGEPGWIRVAAEDGDDLWALYNIVSAGDEVEALTMRRVVQENSQGSVIDSQKIRVLLAVRVEKTDIDIKGLSLRINGKNVRENRHVKLGSYHTLEATVDTEVKISKNEWDSVSIEFLGQALSAPKAEIGAVLVQPADGLAFICTVSAALGVKVLERVQMSVPKKRAPATDRLRERFDQLFFEAVSSRLPIASLKAVALVAAKDDLQPKSDVHHRLFEWATRHGHRHLLDNKAKFIRVPVSSPSLAHPSHLDAVISEPRIAAMLQDTRTAGETRLMDAFHKSDPSMVTFGLDHVKTAADQAAVRSLLLADSLFRSCNVSQRRLYGTLIAQVRENGGSVTIFSPDTPTEQDLLKLSGVAAILNFQVFWEAD